MLASLNHPNIAHFVRARECEHPNGSRDGCPTRRPWIVRRRLWGTRPACRRGFEAPNQDASRKRRRHLPRHGAGRGRRPLRAHPTRRDPDRRGDPDRAADRRGPRGGARSGHRPPRSQTGQHQAHRGRHRQGARLRPRQGVGERGRRLEPFAVADHDPHATAAGIILGTAAYMSPEQARGKKVDRRADIWAFGVVLWEMLTGRKLFEGDTVSDVLASVLKEAPDLEALPQDTPPAAAPIGGALSGAGPEEQTAVDRRCAARIGGGHGLDGSRTATPTARHNRVVAVASGWPGSSPRPRWRWRPFSGSGRRNPEAPLTRFSLGLGERSDAVVHRPADPRPLARRSDPGHDGDRRRLGPRRDHPPPSRRERIGAARRHRGNR